MALGIISGVLAPYIDAGLEHVLLVPLALSADEWRHHVDALAGLIDQVGGEDTHG